MGAHSSKAWRAGDGKRCLATAVVIGLAFFLSAGALRGDASESEPEPNFAMACGWWPELENVWTPIGWKDHTVRFQVLYNGTILVDRPQMSRNFMRRLREVIGSGIQCEFVPSITGELPPPADPTPYTLASRDGGRGQQGWNDDQAPVLWTRWQHAGLTWRQEVFAHGAAGQEVRTGLEPLFAWIRLSVASGDFPRRTGRPFWLIRITRPHLSRSMDRSSNLKAQPERMVYPGRLVFEAMGEAMGGGRLVEAQGRVRLVIVPSPQVRVDFIDRRRQSGDAWLRVELPRGGAAVDLVLAAVPVASKVFEDEVRLGREQVLAQTRRFWSMLPPTAAVVETPEEPINQAIRHGLRIAQVLTVRHPDTHQHVMLTGSWQYEALWSTPGAMVISMFFDPLGYHGVAEKYLEVFREEQGKVRPPGDHYAPHPGCFATPRVVDSIDWLSDHGAILYAAAWHGLVTDDEAFLARWVPAIVKGCEFIRDARARRGHGGIEGLLPPGRATDSREIAQFVWTDGWNYKGLITAVRLLQRIGHPRAAEFTQVAADYRSAFLAAFREAAQRTGSWEEEAGVSHRYVPAALPGGGNPQHPFYLDAGPLFLVFAELLPANDPLMASALHFFRSGPHRKAFDITRSGNHPACLYREISSCEPCYSWNLFHSHQLADRNRFLEGMYSLFAGGMSRQTFVACETRGGISGTVCTHPLAVTAARLAVIDDQVEYGKLHLLRLVPRAWLSAQKETVFARMPTEYGPVTIRFRLEDEGRRLTVRWEPRFRRQPRAVILHVPPLEGLREVRMDGQDTPVRPGAQVPLAVAAGCRDPCCLDAVARSLTLSAENISSR